MATTRELEIEYGDLTVGGSSTTHMLTGAYRLEQGPDSSFIEFEFAAIGATESAFEDSCKDAEEELSIPWQGLTVRLGSATLIDFSHVDSTGFDARPVILKRGDPDDTGRSRTYMVRIDFGMPAAWNEDYPGLRVSRVNVSFSPSRRRTVTISGEFTAIGATESRAQHDAKIAGFASSALSDLGGTYELIGEPLTEATTNDKTMRFQRVYREIVKGQAASGATDDAAIVNQELTIGRREFNDGSAGEGTPLVTANVTYSAWIDKDETTDLTGKWAAIRSWVIAEAETTLALSGSALVSEVPRYFPDDNRIEVGMQIVGYSSSDALSRFVQTEDDYKVGVTFVPVWDENDLAVHEYPGPAVLMRSVVEVTRYPATRSINVVANDAYQARFQPETDQSPFLEPKSSQTVGSAWRVVSRRTQTKRLTIGTQGNTLDVTDYTVRHLMRYVFITSGQSPSSGGSSTTPNGVSSG